MTNDSLQKPVTIKIEKTEFQKIEDKFVEYYTKNNSQNLSPYIIFMFKEKGNVQDAANGFNHVLSVMEKKYNAAPNDMKLLRNLIFLGVVESEWQNKTSPSNAKGYYQLTEIAVDDVSELFKIPKIEITDKNIGDQAKYAALYLTYIYFEVADRDLKLTLTAYNVGRTRLKKYMDLCKKSKKKPDYDGFMKYLKPLINKKDHEQFSNYAPKYYALIYTMRKNNSSFIKLAQGEITYDELMKKYSIASKK